MRYQNVIQFQTPTSLQAHALLGYRDAWDRLIELHNSSVIDYIERKWRIVARTHDPADIAQEAWERVYQRVLAGLSGDKARIERLSLPGLVNHQARWIALEKLKRKHATQEIQPTTPLAEQPIIGPSPCPEAAVIRSRQLDQIWACLEQLTASERKVFIFYYRDLMDYEEISRRMSIQTGAVRMYLSRAHTRIRALLAVNP
ncbi:MAG: sigma-70 family RNA polymerase sigma factor [Myxococcota bacterium]